MWLEGHGWRWLEGGECGGWRRVWLEEDGWGVAGGGVLPGEGCGWRRVQPGWRAGVWLEGGCGWSRI